MKHLARGLRSLAAPTVLALALGSLLGLAACNVPPPQTTYPDITFKHRPALHFDVAEIVIQQTYVPPLEPPNVEHTLQHAPAALARQWAEDRLVASGASGRLIYTIQEASAIQTPMETDLGLEGIFTSEQADRFQIQLIVNVQLVDQLGVMRARVQSEAQRSKTVPEDATLAEREKTWFTLSEAVMKDMDSELETILHQYMAAYILN